MVRLMAGSQGIELCSVGGVITIATPGFIIFLLIEILLRYSVTSLYKLTSDWPFRVAQIPSSKLYISC